MKKIISLFCTLAMVISMAVVAHADENNYVEWKLISKDGGNAVLEAHLVTEEYATACPMFWNFSDAIAKGATNVTIEKVEANIANFTNKDGQIFVQLNYTSVDGYTGDITLARVTVVGITENFEISLMPNSGRTATKVTNTDKAVVTSKFTFPTTSFTLVEDVVKTADATLNDVEKIVAPSGKTTFGISGVVAGGAAFSKIKLAIADVANNLTADYVWELGTSVDANDVTFGLNIWGAPANADITATAVAE